MRNVSRFIRGQWHRLFGHPCDWIDVVWYSPEGYATFYCRCCHRTFSKKTKQERA